MEMELKPICEAALGEPVQSKNMQYFNKPCTAAYASGDGSKPTPPHQDGYYFMIEPQNAVRPMIYIMRFIFVWRHGA